MRLSIARIHSLCAVGSLQSPTLDTPVALWVTQAPKPKKAKRSTEDGAPRTPKAPKASKAPKPPKAAEEEGGKKKRKKKDKNAPKGALSAYMYFGNSQRDSVRCWPAHMLCASTLALRMLARDEGRVGRQFLPCPLTWQRVAELASELRM